MSQAQPRRPGVESSAAAAAETVTIGQALQAVALSPAGARPVDRTDASAVEAAEKSATGLGSVVPGGVAAAARQAAETNQREGGGGHREEGTKATTTVTLKEVLGDAAAAMPGNSNRAAAATWVDAEKVAAATGSSDGRGGGGMGEVADALAAAAHINEGSVL